MRRRRGQTRVRAGCSGFAWMALLYALKRKLPPTFSLVVRYGTSVTQQSPVRFFPAMPRAHSGVLSRGGAVSLDGRSGLAGNPARVRFFACRRNLCADNGLMWQACRAFFVHGDLRTQSFAEIGKLWSTKLRDCRRPYRQRCLALCPSSFPATLRDWSRHINSQRIVRCELTEPSLPSQHAQWTNRIANLPGFAHCLDLIEHRLPQIPWAGSKQFRSAVAGHAAQAVRAAQLDPWVGAVGGVSVNSICHRHCPSALRIRRRVT